MMDSKIQAIFNGQKKYHVTVRNYTPSQRISKLKILREAIQKSEAKIYAALQEDLQKCTFESAVTEVLFVYGEIDFAIKNLFRWIKPVRAGRSMSSFFAKNRIYYEPKGACLIISPWNYPFQLTMAPLVSAIAAGNCVIVKPSELSAAASKVICELINSTFEEQEIACFEGGASVSEMLLDLPFDHIFFTGSAAVGKLVMKAAAKYLSTVTLELGGKSPTIIDSHTNLAMAAEKIAWGKLTNCGQTCIAPDHVFVPTQHLDEFISHYKSAVIRMYFKTPTKLDHHTYGKIINHKHYHRLKGLVEDAIDGGARINWGGHFDEQHQIIAPIILTSVPQHAKIMEEEIFGPILPVIGYTDLADVIKEINQRGKPLALYLFSNRRKTAEHIIKNTSSGGACINDVLVHISSPKLPFGGVNGSGMGSSHGFFGFKNFSHERAVVSQSKLNFNRLIYPPYQGKEWVLKLLRKIM